MDLDNTIFQTLSKQDQDKALYAAALDYEGRPLSFMNSSQRQLIRVLLDKTVVIPVTARDTNSFTRVRLPFNHGAILNFGGLILEPSGMTDQEWYDRIFPMAKDSSGLLNEALAFSLELVRSQSLLAKPRIIKDAELPFYLVIKTKGDPLFELNLLKSKLSQFLDSAVNIYLNGNNLSILPKYLDKGPAVEYFMNKRLPYPKEDSLILGLGDSFSDLGFLNLCDYQIIPTASQLAQWTV
jgi:hypothetical protein